MSPSLPEPLRSFDIIAAAVADQLQQIDALRASYEKHCAAGLVLPNTIEATRIELTYNSNAIEGNTLTLRDTQLVLEGQVPEGSHTMRELYEARNHDRALRMIEQWLATRSPAEPITERHLLDVHAHVMADIAPVEAGRYRSGRVLIAGSGFVPPGPHRFDELIPILLNQASRADVHPAVLAAEFHYNIVAVHPFADGNGRTARLMMNYLLLRYGYPHTIVDVAHRTAYLAALDHANAGRCEPFARFINGCIVRSMERLLAS